MGRGADVVELPGDLDDGPASEEIDLQTFGAYYDEQKRVVDRHLETVLDEQENFEDLRRLLDLALRGGKRLRPVLTVLMADVTGCDRERALTYAVVVELLHNATLVADDWADNDDVRREMPAVWRVLYDVRDHAPDWVMELSDSIPEAIDSRTMTVLTSHNMQAITLQLVRDPDVQRAMGRSVRRVFDGFYLEGKRLDDGAWAGSYDEYIETCRYKTGGFFALSTSMPAIVGPVDQDAAEAARSYGESFGVLYQVADDIADDDLPGEVEDPEAELAKWYERTVSELEGLPVEEGDDGYALLKNAPVWACRQMFDRENVDLRPDVDARLRKWTPVDPTE